MKRAKTGILNLEVLVAAMKSAGLTLVAFIWLLRRKCMNCLDSKSHKCPFFSG